MKKVLILKSDCNEFERFFMKNMKKENIDVYSPYKPLKRKIYFYLRFKHLNSKIPFKYIWYGKYKKYLNDYNLIIVFDFLMGLEILQYLRRKNKKCKIVFWAWNKLEYNPKKYDNSICEFFSFDKGDCIKYELKYNNQFYFPNIVNNSERIKYDAIFVGKDKNRIKKILKIKEFMEKEDLNVKLHVNKDKEYNNFEIDKYLSSESITYEELIKLIGQSKSIIDIVSNNQKGLTLRVMESIFFKKKLITNNESIKEYDFYNPNNIFILQFDDIKNLNSFINSEYDELDKRILEKYEFETWVNSFYEL